MQRNLFCLILLGALLQAFGQQGVASRNPELEQELRYIEMLGELRMPDYAELVLADVERRFPEARATIKVLRIEQQLLQGKFDEVQQIIDAEPDQDAPETWTMRLTMADYLYAFGRYPEALGVYQSFFRKYDGKPPAPLAALYRDSAYKYAQMLLFLERKDEALSAYRDLLKQDLERHVRRQVQFETAELLVRMAKAAPRDSKRHKDLLKEGLQLCEDILWVQDLWFGRGIVLLAHIRVIEGDIEAAQKLIQTYMPQLQNIDEQLMAQGREQGEDFSRLSPLAECRYLMGVMLHDEAKRLLAKGDPTPEIRSQVRDLLVGKRGADGRPAGNGAYQELLNVFVRFPATSWAPDAAQRVEEIEATLEQHQLVRSISANITPEQRLEVARRQFQNARMLFNQQQFENAVDVYLNALRQFPELVPESISALSELARAYIEQWDPNQAETRIHDLYADTVIGYLAERFSQHSSAMTQAGDELRRIADFYEERGHSERRRAVLDLFFNLYAEHPMAAPMLMSTAETAFRAEDYDTALRNYERLAEDYQHSPLSYDAMSRIAEVHRRRSEPELEIKALHAYVERLEARDRPGQPLVTARFQLAQAYRTRNVRKLRSDTPEEVEAANEGLRRTVQLYSDILTMLEDDDARAFQANEEERRRNQTIREASLFGRAYSLSVMTLPEDRVEEFKHRAIEVYEEMLQAFPESEYAPGVLSQIGTLWVTLGDNTKADEALTRLNERFPDSNEARMALYTRGRTLIELGFRGEGVRVLTQMFEDASRYPPHQMLAAGRELLQSREYELALQAFDAAIEGAADQQSISMPATLGRANVLLQQEQHAEAVEVLEGFLKNFPRSMLTIDANLKLSQAASELAVTQAERRDRVRLFNRAIEAMRVVRGTRTEPGELARTDNDIGQILLRKAEAERRHDDAERARTFTLHAIAHWITVIDSANPSLPEVAPHLEESFRQCIPLMLRVNEPGDAAEYAQRYLELFPSGRFVTDVRNWLNEATIALSSAR